ncbi:MAG: VWA domain-containing protein [Myxococcota bacterium]
MPALDSSRLAACWGLSLLLAGGAAHAGAVSVRVDSPPAGSVVESELHMAELTGLASAEGEGARGYDVMIVIDVSRSTQSASGADVDEDGEIGEDPHLGLFAPGEYPDDVYSTDPDDTILHAEVRAANVLLDGLDAARVRVGLISFSGAVDPATGTQVSRTQFDATLQVPLTQDFGRIRGALSRVLARGPHGATNFADGLRLATKELAGLSGATSKPRPGAQPVILFLTDGVPSFPSGQATVSDPGDIEAAVAAARVAQAAGIRINTFAVGPDALAKPKAATEVARVTLGTYTPVLEPGAIVAALQSVSFANVEDIGVVNLTTQEPAPDVRLNPDGSFQAFVPVREGTNRVLVNALASDGSEANTEIVFEFRVAEKQGLEKQAELARLRKLNDELIRHLEAERIKRARREQRLRKELEIRVENPDEASPTPGGG